MEKEASLEVHPVLEGTLIISVHRHTLVPDCWDEMSVAEANKKLQRDLLSRMPTLVQMSLGHHAKKIQRNQLNIYHKEKGQESLSYEDCPQNWKHFLNKNYMQAVPTIYAGKSYMLFLHLLAFQTLFFCILHLPYPARFPWPPVTERQRWHSRVICGLLIIHSKSSATVAREVQTSVLLPRSWELHQA